MSTDRHANPELVLVEVGKEKEKFMLPKSLLCHKSSFFAAALKPDSPFVEAKHNVVKMPEEDASLFDDFVSWVYNEYQTLRFDPNKQSTVEDAMQELTEDAMQELIEDAMKELIDLFDLGDRLGALELQREMIREFFILLAGIPDMHMYPPALHCRYYLRKEIGRYRDPQGDGDRPLRLGGKNPLGPRRLPAVDIRPARVR